MYTNLVDIEGKLTLKMYKELYICYFSFHKENFRA